MACIQHYQTINLSIASRLQDVNLMYANRAKVARIREE